MKTVIILNAPPHSCKDTLANIMVQQCAATKQEFKTALYHETAKFYDMDLDLLIACATERTEKDDKDGFFFKLYGVTPRDALINVSENVIKPNKGLDYFGIKAAKNLSEGLNVFSDGGGWLPEIKPVIQVADKVLICRLYRHGFTFDNDSRQYYPSTVAGAVVTDIHLEEGNPLAAVDTILQLIKE